MFQMISNKESNSAFLFSSTDKLINPSKIIPTEFYSANKWVWCGNILASHVYPSLTFWLNYYYKHNVHIIISNF